MKKIDQRDFLYSALEKIKEIKDEEKRDGFLKSLRKSIEFQQNQNPEKLPSPEEIAREAQLDLAVLVEYHVFLNKEQAVSFLLDKGKQISLETFRKLSSKNVYRRKFNRDVTENRTTHIYSYSEILVLVDHRVELKIDPIDPWPNQDK